MYLCRYLRCWEDAQPHAEVDLDIEPEEEKAKRQKKQVRQKTHPELPAIVSIPVGETGQNVNVILGTKATYPLYVELTVENIILLKTAFANQISGAVSHSPALSHVKGVGLDKSLNKVRVCYTAGGKQKRKRFPNTTAGIESAEAFALAHQEADSYI
jgi:hypothetical protein